MLAELFSEVLTVIVYIWIGSIVIGMIGNTITAFLDALNSKDEGS